MNTFEYEIIKSIVQKFSIDLAEEYKKQISVLAKANIKTNHFAPKIFLNDVDLEIKTAYSLDRKSWLIFYNKRTSEPTIQFSMVEGNVLGAYGFGILTDFQRGAFTLQDVGVDHQHVDYGLVFDDEFFHEASKDVAQYVRAMIYIHHSKSVTGDFGFLNYLRHIKYEMEKLFFDENTKELDIDKFIELNPVILEQCLYIITPLHQSILRNVQGTNPQDFKPDVIGYDRNEKVWKIVDYKRAKRSITKNSGKARHGFKAEVYELQNQLRDYVRYFDDKIHRSEFKKNYGVIIEYPRSIGIIGHIPDDELTEYNELVRDLPKWFDIVPYNFLYERFVRFVSLVECIAKSIKG